MSHQNRYAQKYWVTLDPGFFDFFWYLLDECTLALPYLPGSTLGAWYAASFFEIDSVISMNGTETSNKVNLGPRTILNPIYKSQ